tara:strand:+ start:4978 stop:5274 length:297 start_codon:yes stop_codon:yes gene_type:complete
MLAKEISRLPKDFFDNVDISPIEEELSLLDDFMLNDLIEAALFSDSATLGNQLGVNSLGLALGVWSIRHPLSLPPCFKNIQKSNLVFGISAIYEWPNA